MLSNLKHILYIYIYLYTHLLQAFYGNRLNIEEEIQNIRDHDCVTVSVIGIDPHRPGKKSVVITQDKCPLVTPMLFSSWESHFRINLSLFWEPAKQTNKQASKQASKQANKQTSKQASKQTNKQASKQTNIQTRGYESGGWLHIQQNYIYIYVPILLTA